MLNSYYAKIIYSNLICKYLYNFLLAILRTFALGCSTHIYNHAIPLVKYNHFFVVLAVVLALMVAFLVVVMPLCGLLGDNLLNHNDLCRSVVERFVLAVIHNLILGVGDSDGCAAHIGQNIALHPVPRFVLVLELVVYGHRRLVGVYYAHQVAAVA